jgi:flavin-dependent trigonelline monooxygenase, reductase component
MELDTQAFRQCLSNFITGVTVVTTLDSSGEPHGMTVNSFTSVSLKPPLVLVCIANGANSFQHFNRCNAFTINILREEQREISNRFASKESDKFRDVSWSIGAAGGPRLDNSLATLDCFVHERIPAGDHLILIGRVNAFNSAPSQPLVFGQGNYISFAAQKEIISGHPHLKTNFACIAESKGRILLVRDSERDMWTLPGARMENTRSGVAGALEATLSKLGATVRITFLYSLFEDPDQDRINIVYRGILTDGPNESENARLFSNEEMPWGSLSPPFEYKMLRRYFRERSIARFGVYTQINTQGRIAIVDPEPASVDDHQEHN